MGVDGLGDVLPSAHSSWKMEKRVIFILVGGIVCSRGGLIEPPDDGPGTDIFALNCPLLV